MTESAEGAKRIAQWVQGFENYETHAPRGESDAALRAYLLEKVETYARSLAGSARESAMLGSGGETARAALQILGERLADLGDKVRSVPYAFGEFMTASYLECEEAASFYQRDEVVLRELSAIQALLEPTLTEKSDLDLMVDELGRHIHALRRAVKQRQEAISDYSSGSGAGAE